MKKATVLVLLLASVLQVRTGAWGAAGHRVVSRAAILALPSDVPPFLARQIDWIGSRSVLADSWRGPHEPFSKAAEDPNHVWYTEQFAFLKQVPRSRDEFMLAVYDEHLRLRASDPAKAALTNIHYTGTLPYAVIEGYERLKVAFRTWRTLRAQKQDTNFIEQDAAFYLGWMSHYVADGAQPLHSTIQHDGWVGDNPKGYTRDGAIHWLFENTFVDLIALHERDIQARIPVTSSALTDPFAAVLAHVDHAHTRLDQVYQLDRRKEYARKDSREGRELVYTTTAEASTLLRDLVYTAWVNSARGEPDFDPNDQTNNPKNPRYNPATGAAPPQVPAVR
ncbi:MAG: nuclease [Vicinamibacterales bacterium]